MFTLISMGTGAAWLYSVVAVLAPQLFPPAFHTDGNVAVYFEAASVITVLVLLGQVLELRAREHTSDAIFARFWTSRPRPRDCSTRVAVKRKCRSTALPWVTGCACGPVRKFLSMANRSKAALHSTNLW